MINLTEKETMLLEAIKRGMDRPGCGWLHEIVCQTSLSEKSAAGVLGSLVKKGLVLSEEDDNGEYVCYWVTLKR